MERLVVGIDGSYQSKEALRFAIKEGELHDVPVLAVHAWSLPIPPVDPLAPSAVAPIDYPALLEGPPEAADRLLESVIEEAVGAKRNAVRSSRLRSRDRRRPYCSTP
jgi:nucleotide-binding universal stress UspA family protein